MSQEVYRFYGCEFEQIEPVGMAPTGSLTAALLVSPARYQYNAKVYDLTRPGYYVFWTPFADTTRRAVHDGDDFAVLSSAAWWCTHGTVDARVSGEADAAFWDRLSAKARTSQINLQCTDTHRWVSARLLNPSGIFNRTVRFITLDDPNGHDDSHVCLEVEIAGSWRLFDVSGNRLFADLDGNRLSASAATDRFASGQWSAELVADDVSSAANPAVVGKYDAGFWALTRFHSEAMARAWYQRICQAVGIDFKDPDGVVRCYWKLPAGQEYRKAWLEARAPNWIVLDPASWEAKFYP